MRFYLLRVHVFYIGKFDVIVNIEYNKYPLIRVSRPEFNDLSYLWHNS